MDKSVDELMAQELSQLQRIRSRTLFLIDLDMKYIDAEKLIASLEQRKKQLTRWTDKDYANQRIDEIDCILDVDIDSLQQEQPEVDLEKEIETYFKGWYMDETDQGYILHTPDDHAGLMSVKQIARHFYELGLNAKEE